MKKLEFTLRQFIFRSYLARGNTTEICSHISKKSLANIVSPLDRLLCSMLTNKQ